MKAELPCEPFLLSAVPFAPGQSRLFDRLASIGRAEMVAAGDAMDRLAALATDWCVIFVSTKAESLAGLDASRGVLPVLLGDDAPLSLERNDYLSIRELEQIAPLFDGSVSSVLGLLRLNLPAAQARFRRMAEDHRRLVERAGGLHIFGAGTIGRQVLNDCRRRNVAVRGFVENNSARHGCIECGIPIGGVAELDPRTDVVVVSAGNHAEAILQQLRQLGFAHAINLSQFFYLIQSADQPEPGYLDDLAANRIRWICLSLLLGDARSRQVVDAVVRHRLALDTSCLAKVRDRDIPQWFDPAFLKPDPRAVFVDGGAFDGDTAEAFRRFNGPARRIHAFEPDSEIAARARERLAGFPEAIVHARGLSNRPARIGFVRTGITDGRLAPDDACEEFAEVTSVDAVVPESLTYLKLDVEGAEAMAIAGAARQIERNKPTIGLAVYHKPGDPWLLPMQIAELDPGYRFYMRHYTDVAFETVIYAAPGSAK